MPRSAAQLYLCSALHAQGTQATHMQQVAFPCGTYQYQYTLQLLTLRPSSGLVYVRADP
jgi:hypothetical protein